VPVLALEGRALLVHLGGPHVVLSSALVNGGLRRAREVAWLEVRDDELRPPVDPERLARGRLAELGLPAAVGLLTSRAVARYVVAERAVAVGGDGVAARCVATVGLGNALRAGDPPGLASTGVPVVRVGTINLLCQVSAPLSEEALVEALAVAAEARTLAVLEASVPSRRSGLPATGTGTDCVVVAAPLRDAGEARERHRFAGMHTALGHVIGASVYEAVARGVREWLAEQAAAGAVEAG
jgi:adenosylcobinamide amidohydrolase